MRYRVLGKTGLKVSEIGLGAEWLERHNTEEVKEIIDICEKEGINILDCWMSEPNVRSNIGLALKGRREKWIIQGHIGSTWQDGQYVRSKALADAKPAFDMMPAVRDLDRYFEADTYKEGLDGIAPIREGLYKLCAQQNVGITVMKGYAGVLAGYDTPEHVYAATAYETARELLG